MVNPMDYRCTRCLHAKASHHETKAKGCTETISVMTGEECWCKVTYHEDMFVYAKPKIG